MLLIPTRDPIPWRFEMPRHSPLDLLKNVSILPSVAHRYELKLIRELAHQPPVATGWLGRHAQTSGSENMAADGI